MSSRSGDAEEPVVIRDNRKIDRETGEVRAEAGAAEDQSSAASAEDEAILDDALTSLLAERTADLQRVQAEYANYRKRADRERQAAGEVAVSAVLAALLPVLDNLDRARDHGDLTGALKAVADQLDDVFTKLGVEAFGVVGDPFDPTFHEAVLHNESDEVELPTVTTVMRPGYMHGERMLRAAMVGVTDPASVPPPSDPSAAPSDPTDTGSQEPDNSETESE